MTKCSGKNCPKADSCWKCVLQADSRDKVLCVEDPPENAPECYEPIFVRYAERRNK